MALEAGRPKTYAPGRTPVRIQMAHRISDSARRAPACRLQPKPPRKPRYDEIPARFLLFGGRAQCPVNTGGFKSVMVLPRLPTTRKIPDWSGESPAPQDAS
jgi:hypothetical protein